MGVANPMVNYPILPALGGSHEPPTGGTCYWIYGILMDFATSPSCVLAAGSVTMVPGGGVPWLRDDGSGRSGPNWRSTSRRGRGQDFLQTLMLGPSTGIVGFIRGWAYLCVVLRPHSHIASIQMRYMRMERDIDDTGVGKPAQQHLKELIMGPGFSVIFHFSACFSWRRSISRYV